MRIRSRVANVFCNGNWELCAVSFTGRSFSVTLSVLVDLGTLCAKYLTQSLQLTRDSFKRSWSILYSFPSRFQSWENALYGLYQQSLVCPGASGWILSMGGTKKRSGVWKELPAAFLWVDPVLASRPQGLLDGPLHGAPLWVLLLLRPLSFPVARGHCTTAFVTLNLARVFESEAYLRLSNFGLSSASWWLLLTVTAFDVIGQKSEPCRERQGECDHRRLGDFDSQK